VSEDVVTDDQSGAVDRDRRRAQVCPVEVATNAVPSWTTIELLTSTADRGLEWSALTGPMRVSENSHMIRPSGSNTDAAPSPPLHRPLVSR
jgi:hypothetical protein